MINKPMIAMTLACLSLASCSSKEEPVNNTNTITTYTPPVISFGATVTTDTSTDDPEPDVVSSATTITEDTEFGDTTYELFYKHDNASSLLLDTFPNADTIVYYAFSTPYVLDTMIPLEVIHQSIKESLGDRYESVRASYDLLTLDEYRSNPEGMAEARSRYGVTFDDLGVTWFAGATETEKNLLQTYILDYFNINDLLSYNHYSTIENIDLFFEFYQTIAEVETYLAIQDAQTQENTTLLLQRIFDQPSQITGDEYVTQLTYNLTVKELLDLRIEFSEVFSDEIRRTTEDILGKRIGYYYSDRRYGISTIEYILPEGQAANNVVTYSNVTETEGTGVASSKTIQLYLPNLQSELYLIITMQEITYNPETMYTYLKVETTSRTDYDTHSALQLHSDTEQRIAQLISEGGIEGYEEITLPEEPIVEELIPEEVFEEEAIPEETIPEETIPEETIPEETIPEETIPEDSGFDGETLSELPASNMENLPEHEQNMDETISPDLNQEEILDSTTPLVIS